MKNETGFSNSKKRMLFGSRWTAILVVFIWCCFLSCNTDEELSDSEILIEPGTYELSIEVDAITRWYTLVIPTGYDHVDVRPLVFAFHPGNANMNDFYNALQGFREKAELENWLMVFPNGRNTTDNRTGECLWHAIHCCGMAYNQNVDDVGFVRHLLQHLQSQYKIDEKRIYATGRSNGGMLVHRLGGEMWDNFAAIAPFAATAGGRNTENSPEEILELSNNPLPVLLMHGLHDAIVLHQGGLGGGGVRYDISFEETAMIWLENNGCDMALADTTVIETEDGKSWILDFQNCQEGTQVTAITVENSDHQLPRISNSGFDGTNAIVKFFKAHSKN